MLATSWVFIIICCIGLLPALLFMPVKKVGYTKKIERKQKLILCLNHYSMADIALLIVSFPFRILRFLGKKELFENKLVGFLAKGFGAIPVARGEGDLKAVKTVCKVINSNQPIAIFPEGTRNREQTAGFMEIKSGVALFALKTGAKIVPMYQPTTPRPFKRNYLYIGEPFDMSSVPGEKINRQRVALATELLAKKLNEAREGMEKYIQENNIKIKYVKVKFKEQKVVANAPEEGGEIEG